MVKLNVQKISEKEIVIALLDAGMDTEKINEFIEKMEEVGDVWTEEQVNDVYGDSSFEDALADRQSSLDHMSAIISKAINK